MPGNCLQRYQSEFLDLAMEYQVLVFGTFTLKSGRVSPYFFNLGHISSGTGFRRLSHAYAAALDAASFEFDVIFGPAYKGIPLAVGVSCAFAERGREVGFAYDRKEAKDHGEGGVLVGADIKGRRVVIVDDVLTAGTAMKRSIRLLREAGATPVSAIIALDREERGSGDESAVTELAREERIQVGALVGIREILDYLGSHDRKDENRRAVIEAIQNYQARYGASRSRDSV